VNQKHAPSATGLSLPNQSAVEADVIGLSNTHPQNRRFTVDGDSPSANPVFDLAA
jgi:hypothetical protein